jgi:hypothetical protein
VEAARGNGTAVVSPVPLGPGWRHAGEERGRYTEQWQATGDVDWVAAARDLLLAMRDGEFELIESGYLDLRGDAWGCTVRDPQGRTFVVTLMPELPLVGRGEGNPLKLTITRFDEPDWMGQ